MRCAAPPLLGLPFESQLEGLGTSTGIMGSPAQFPRTQLGVRNALQRLGGTTRRSLSLVGTWGRLGDDRFSED